MAPRLSMTMVDYSQGGQPVARGPLDAEPSLEAALDPEELPGLPEPLAIAAREGAGQRVDRFLAQALAGRLPGVSRSRLQQWLGLGAVWCDERPLQAATRLAGYETLHVQPLPREADQAFEPDPIALTLRHQDADLLVVDKPVGLVVHPAPGHWRGTLLNGLLYLRAQQASLPRAGIVHRLDKDTSGLMVVAASERGLSALSAQLADRSMSRRYLALAQGRLPAARTIDAPIGRDPRQRTRMGIVEPPAGRPARTHIRPLAFGTLGARACTLLECRLETGRTHQIRVHLQHLGHPLIGDTLYAGWGGFIGRQALHAWRLALRHPSGEQPCAWDSEPPADFQQLCESAGIELAPILADLLEDRVGEA